MRLKGILEKRIATELDNTAFISDNQKVSTNGFLNAVQSISYELKKRNFIKGNRILILSQKSIPAIAGIFSCLFEGYIFAPIDANTPEERLRFIINDCLPSGIIIDKANIERLGKDFFNEFHNTQIISFDDINNSEAMIKIDYESSKHGHLSTIKTDCLTDEDLAYIIYTSGSTGTPKGVSVSRAALCSFIESSIEKAGYNKETKFLNFFPLHFDPVLMEIIMPWVVGGTTVLFNKFLYINDLVKALQKYKITDFSCTPNIITMLVSRISHYYKYDWSFLRSIWFGGENANLNDIRKFWDITPHVILFNGYGPTETVVACSLHELRKKDLEADILPIGTPMNGVIFKLVNDGYEIIEDNKVGELYVGGNQLMEGYWGKIGDLVKNNFIIFENQKYYKTDDNVYKKDNLYYFVGRKSTMIKLRGYRIFPSEIENAFNSIDEVANSCVIFDERNMQLIGVIELNSASKPNSDINERIVEKLKLKLPVYMIPEKIVYQEKLPRMSSGKLDIQKIKTLLEV